jgi:uncharacterized protein YecT (DUF1311 family)
MIMVKTAVEFDLDIPQGIVGCAAWLESDLRTFAENKREEWDDRPDSWHETQEAGDADDRLEELINVADSLREVAGSQDEDALELLRAQRAWLADRLTEIDGRIARVNFGGSAAASL